MKKTILSAILITLMLLNLTGCAGSEDKLPQETLNEVNPAEQEIKASKEDMKDMDALYEFFKQEITDLSRENFDLWEVNHLDITGDGSEEAIFAGVHGVEAPQKMQIISGDTGEYKKIPSNILLAKYQNLPALQDGFFTVTKRTGGTGEEFTEMEFYIYNGSGMVKVLEGLLINHRVSFPGQADFEENAELVGKLTDFTYTLTKQDNMTNKASVEKKAKYTYNADTMSFLEEPLAEQASDAGSDNKQISYNVNNGSLQVTYDNKTVTVIEANKIYDFTKENEDVEGQEKLYVLRVINVEGDKLYFAVKAPDYSVGDVIYYMDLKSQKLYWVGSGEDLENSEAVRLSGFSNETIRDVEIDYRSYSAAIIPFYPANGANYESLSQVPFMDNPNGKVLEFAVMGKLEDLKLTYIENIGAEGVEWEIGELENAVLNIHSDLPTDMSSYKITGRVHVGEGLYEDISFTLDDMRDSSEYEVYLIK